MNGSRILCFILILGLLIFSCNDHENTAYPDLKIFLDRFQQEAKSRGYDFDLSAVQAVYVDEIKKNNVTYCGWGYPNYDGNGLRRIEISKSSPCYWGGYNDLERENLFFHEIGHAFFNRSHNLALQCDGTPLSLMMSNSDNWRIYTEAEGAIRDYYIKELIDPKLALTKCIKDEKNWSIDSAFYRISKTDLGWSLYSDNGKYKGVRGTSDFTGNEFLTIETISGVDSQVNGYWIKPIDCPNIPECAEVKYKVTMNSNLLTGNGAAISLRAYKPVAEPKGAETVESFHLTTESNPVAGILVNYKVELTIPCFSRSTDQIYLFVVMKAGTQGKVTFDNIEVIVKSK